LSAVFILLSMYVLYSGVTTLQRLDIVEAERDSWQRPWDVVRALDLHEGNTVVDLGSGAGYFALKLASAVGPRGRVLAVDLRKISLFFLWTRAWLRGRHNIDVIVGEEDNPKLPANTTDAALICNTFHEFRDPGAVLHHLLQALRPGARLVLVDRAPHELAAEQSHEVSRLAVESELQRDGFEIVSHDDHFIEPHNNLWWMVIARKP
jgi:ubiquinone/menaquinone biosynthesis C-methylase UbiE